MASFTCLVLWWRWAEAGLSKVFMHFRTSPHDLFRRIVRVLTWQLRIPKLDVPRDIKS